MSDKLPLQPTCSSGLNLHKQAVFAQAATQEEGADVMSCLLHGLQNLKRTKLRDQNTTQEESGYKMEASANSKKPEVVVPNVWLTARAWMVAK